MKLRNTFRTLTQKLSKKTVAVASTLAVVAGFGFSFGQAAFFPERPVYDYNKGSDASNCLDVNDPGYANGRCGSMNGPVFNSFINTPSYGDERSFADARRSDQTAAGSYTNTVYDSTEGSQEVVIRTYIHNNANDKTNANGVGIAKDTKVRVLLPTGSSNGLRARSYISASNASMVEDTVDFTANKNFKMEYVPGSAKLYNYGVYKNGVQISDSVVTTGALIGDDKLDGELPGCFDYASTVEIRVKIVPVTTPTVTQDFTKQVKLNTADAWTEKVTAKPGDNVKWLVYFKNTGTTDLTNVILSDKLPPHLTIVPGSVKYIDAAQTVAQNDAQFFTTGGINFNTWKPNGGFYVRFETIAKDDFAGCEVSLRNIAYSDTDQTGKIEDSADVVIKKENCVPAKVVTCDLLSASKYTAKLNEQVAFTANATATNGATISSYQFLVNGVEAQNTSSSTFNFSRPTAGTYTVRVVVKSSEGDKTSAACEKQITVEQEVVRTVTCDLLTAPKYTLKTGESTTFTATGTATNTTITGYEFKVNGVSVQNTASNTYTFTQNNAGAYTVTVTVTSPVGDVTSPSCAKTVDVTTVNEPTPIYRCEATTLSSSSVKTGEKVKVNVRFTAKDGAAFKLATFKFGDNTDAFVTNKVVNGDQVEAEHVYTAKGTYGIQVKLDFTVNGQTKSVEGGNCVAQVTVDTPKEVLPEVTEIPNTGAGSILAIFASVTAAGAVLHSALARRSVR